MDVCGKKQSVEKQLLERFLELTANNFVAKNEVPGYTFNMLLLTFMDSLAFEEIPWTPKHNTKVGQ